MQMNFDSAGLATRSAALPRVPTITLGYDAPRSVPAPQSNSVHFTAWQENLRGEALENLVWVVVGLCSAAVLALSIFA